MMAINCELGQVRKEAAVAIDSGVVYRFSVIVKYFHLVLSLF